MCGRVKGYLETERERKEGGRGGDGCGNGRFGCMDGGAVDVLKFRSVGLVCCW